MGTVPPFFSASTHGVLRSQLITFDRSHLGALNQILMNELSYIPRQLVYQYACHILSTCPYQVGQDPNRTGALV